MSGEPAADAEDGIPEFARPLVDACTLAGVNVRWNLNRAEWLKVHANIKRSGTAALADFASRQASARQITYARYFLPGWLDLPPLPRPGAERPVLKAVSGGYQPWRNPEDHADYESGF